MSSANLSLFFQPLSSLRTVAPLCGPSSPLWFQQMPRNRRRAPKKNVSNSTRGGERRASRAGQPRLFPRRTATGPRSRPPVPGFCLKETSSTRLATPGRTWCPSRGLSHSSCYLQGVFFNWASPEFAKCWPVSNRFKKKTLESQTGPP